MIESDARILNYRKPLDYTELIKALEIFSERYPMLSFSYIGESILGRPIPLITLGTGNKKILYVAAHRATEWITSVLLLRFINEFCEFLCKESLIYRTSLPLLCEQYTIHVIPMLNPDGVDYQINGVKKDNPFYERLIKMNGESDDFSHWQANARGVDLACNYTEGFEKDKKSEWELGFSEGAPARYPGECPESEPEVGHLCNFIRFHEGLRLILTLHTAGEKMIYQSAGKTPGGATAIARRISALSGYQITNDTDIAENGSLGAWCIRQLNLPTFTLACGKGENPLPISCYFPIYASLREVFFTIPKMV